MFGVFGWLRERAKNAVLGGVADAVEQLNSGEEPVANLDRLRALLAAPQPAGDEAADEVTTTKRRAR
jgi:hypothetical protein